MFLETHIISHHHRFLSVCLSAATIFLYNPTSITFKTYPLSLPPAWLTHQWYPPTSPFPSLPPFKAAASTRVAVNWASSKARFSASSVSHSPTPPNPRALHQPGVSLPLQALLQYVPPILRSQAQVPNYCFSALDTANGQASHFRTLQRPHRTRRKPTRQRTIRNRRLPHIFRPRPLRPST